MPILGIVASSIKPLEVTGGTLFSDANFNYRVFTANGTLGVTGGTLVADILVIGAGGGAGVRGNRGGGGGGAGGVLAFASESLTPANYTCTIGAGGAGGTSANGFGSGSASLGNNSIFGALTTVLGGGGGDINSFTVGSQGGCSDGFGQSTNNTPSQLGNLGGTGTNSGGGGGGGAGAVGANGSGNNGGAGGIGADTVTNWGALSDLFSATGLGSGGRIAGGGGGGGSSAGGVGGTGGGGNGSISSPVAGGSNTGGGGGAPYNTSITISGANGGSGVLVVRYAL
jgi:hypothetical protein